MKILIIIYISGSGTYDLRSNLRQLKFEWNKDKKSWYISNEIYENIKNNKIFENIKIKNE